MCGRISEESFSRSVAHVGETLGLLPGRNLTHTNTHYLCVEEGQTPDSVEGDQHFDQKLFMLRFQRQSETIDYTGRDREREGRQKKNRENTNIN